jgi:hypothetical protein
MVPKLPLGLYEAQLVRSAKSEVGTMNGEAWLLVVDSSHYAELASSFTGEMDIVKGWDDLVDESARRTFLRACLEYLASSQAN